MDSGNGVHLLGAARTTKVRTQPNGSLVKSQTKHSKTACKQEEKKSLEVQQFLWGLDSKQEPGSLNEDLIHTYFFVGDYEPTKQLIHGYSYFFFLCLLFLLTWLLLLAGVILSRVG